MHEMPLSAFQRPSHRAGEGPREGTRLQATRLIRAGRGFPDARIEEPVLFRARAGAADTQGPHRHIALSYLRASWQVEDREAPRRRLLENAREHYIAALTETGTNDPQYGDLALLCGEIERRLGKWGDAEKRFRDLESSGILKGTPQADIPALQLRLIAQHDSAPHLLDGADVAQIRDAKIPRSPTESPRCNWASPASRKTPAAR